MYIISVNKPRYFRNGNDYADQYLPVQAEGSVQYDPLQPLRIPIQAKGTLRIPVDTEGDP